MYSNSQFENLIINGKKSEIVSILKNKDICIYIIENNLFWINLDLILKLFDQNMIITFLKYLNSYSTDFLSYEIIKFFEYDFSNRFYLFLFDKIEKSKLDSKVIYEYILKNNLLKVSPYSLFISMYKKEYDELLYNNLDTILENCYNIFDIKDIVYKRKKYINKINEFIEENSNNLIYDIIINSIGKSKEMIDKEKIFSYVKTVVDELLHNEHISYSQIEKIGQGGSSIVYSIGNKILKIGKERETFLMDNNKRYLKPILRTNINSLITDEILFCIEITEKVDTDNITIEDTYQIYKELREQGLVWLDCRPLNLGRLKKKNSIHMKEGINPVYYSIGYNNENYKELEKGELVILDNDYIFPEDYFISYIGFDKENYSEEDLICKFEDRYQEEKKQKNY